MSSNQPPNDNQNRDDLPDENSDIPASVAFMEMMRQAAQRRQREQASFTAPAPTEAPMNPEEAAPAPRVYSRQRDVSPVSPPAAPPLPTAHDEEVSDQPSPAEVRRVRRRQSRRPQRATFLGGVLRLVIIIPLAAALVAIIFNWFTPPSLLPELSRQDLSAVIATDTFATFQPTTQPTPNWLKKIGVVSGHHGPQEDPGAVCTDGVGNAVPPTENEINFSVAERVVNGLRGMGYSVDLLDEFDPRLDNYQAAALVSIHANTCQEWPGGEVVSGFLIAGPSSRTSMRGNDELLVGCIAQYYGNMTGLERRAGVTVDMSDYHSFREIHQQTPAAIIELGFMLADHQLLTTQPDLMAQAITNGILCFIEPALSPTVAAPAAGE